MKDLNYQLKNLCTRNPDGSHNTQADRQLLLQGMANQLFKLGYRRMEAKSLKPKHIDALVAHYLEEGLSSGTIKNRLSILRWWAEKIGKQNVVAKDNAYYGIAERVFVTNISKARDLDSELLEKITDPHIKISLELQKAFGLRREEAIKFSPDYADKRRERAQDMADAMALYCSGTAGHFFNRVGKAWPEADVTILEMGILANEGYEDQLALGFMGLMNQINGVVEREQYDSRPTFVLGDEAHLITTNPLLAIFLVKIVKMWRKLGAWLWLATQNLEDFPDAAKKLLNMFEWWIAMVCPKEEIEQISRFKDLSDEQKGMLRAARKEPGKYTEGVVLSDNLQCLFRNVPPSLALALAMTEKHEKQQRSQIMQEQHCSELEAVFAVADLLERKKKD